MNHHIGIITISSQGIGIAEAIRSEIHEAEIFTLHSNERYPKIEDINSFFKECFGNYDCWCFIGAMGICIRSIAPFVQDKHSDPAVINIDSGGKYVVSVLSGHVGGANKLCTDISHIIGAQPVISTQSDNNDLWALDMLGDLYDWMTVSNTESLNKPIIEFVNGKKTAVLLEIRDKGTDYLERTAPSHVQLFYAADQINPDNFDLIITVSPRRHEFGITTLQYIPRVLSLGIGCRKACNPDHIKDFILTEIERKGFRREAIKDVSTIELKKDEPLIHDFGKEYPIVIYRAEDLEDVAVSNPSQKVKEVTGIAGVSESCAIKSAHDGYLMIGKQKGCFSKGNDFTFALAIDKDKLRAGHIEIVGAGPGDPDLISVRGRYFLEKADLILYAGSLVPKELTLCAKDGAVVRSSATMNLEEQFALMKEFYDKGAFIVRLHTGDPCIYGAIQEQMAFFDEYGMSYHITPGISSFQAAAAALKSQFTIPEKIQTIILTRGEGRTPMPEKEKLHMLARSQSTMCIFLSAGIVDEVQSQLLEHYPPTTPVAACYHLTWKDERIYRGELKDLAKIVKDNNLTLTTMLVVGDSIDNRKGLSKLYSHQFKHLFRP
ncbi:precorrin-4 C(11)-methyltransferase [Porphyromonas pogonae]|uniref:precorrin-4 C(11)-methyltransferase n=1 Tax=Porphyromonas pogonae TaxID=867595 RepID=UPI002E772330|nr:precorrin-4 C(11)-methyltransferase [Porphyromonas pogonae]